MASHCARAAGATTGGNATSVIAAKGTKSKANTGDRLRLKRSRRAPWIETRAPGSRPGVMESWLKGIVRSSSRGSLKKRQRRSNSFACSGDEDDEKLVDEEERGEKDEDEADEKDGAEKKDEEEDEEVDAGTGAAKL